MKITDLQGAIFDVDDTLLDNYFDGSGVGLHERSRLVAAHEVGKRYNSKGLQEFTIEQCKEAFINAKVHNLESTVWEMLYMAGEVDRDQVDPQHPMLLEMMELKEDMHEDVLRSRGGEVPGAVKFVELLAENGLAGKLAVASTSCRRDIDVFFEMTGLHRYFPDDHIVSRERMTNAKPNPEAFDKAFATLGLPDESRKFVVAFEDDPRGVMSAKAAGLYVCAIATRNTKEDLMSYMVPPDVVADSYAEFAQMFGLTLPAAAR
jgi:beta-phosphoglucomutase-like phosphatase (HAD superfamily)